MPLKSKFYFFCIIFITQLTHASDRLSILDFSPAGTAVDRGGKVDASAALSNAITAANLKTVKGEPACVYIPPGVYRISKPSPMFLGAGCLRGDGSTQSTVYLDPTFKGDLFSWSEAWSESRPGPTVVGIRVSGSKSASEIQNAFVFYDRNDKVFIDDLEVDDVHGRALYSGVIKKAPSAYMRESHMRSMRIFGCGASDVPAVEFSSQGSGNTDASNEIRISQFDIYGSNGPSLIIRNRGTGSVRNINIEGLRIEGLENGKIPADLLTIGDSVMPGNVNNIVITNIELIDPYPGYAAVRLTAAPGSAAPYEITIQGSIGGGIPNGQGLRIDAGRKSYFRFSGIHTFDTNVILGPNVSEILLDGGGQEPGWTYKIDPTSMNQIHVPTLRTLDLGNKTR